MRLCDKDWQWLIHKTYLGLEDVNDRAYMWDEEWRIITQEDLSNPQVFEMYAMIEPSLMQFVDAAGALLSYVKSKGGVDNHYITTEYKDEAGDFRWISK